MLLCIVVDGLKRKILAILPLQRRIQNPMKHLRKRAFLKFVNGSVLMSNADGSSMVLTHRSCESPVC